LNDHNIFTYRDLSVIELNKFQEHCINNKVTNKNITEIFYALKIVYNRLLIKGIVKHNIIKDIVLVKRNKAREKGIFNTNDIKGIFRDEWENNVDEYLINLIAIATGMRNSEIRLLKVDNFEIINDIHFINVIGTKTDNAIRKVPVNNFVYEKIQKYIQNNNRNEYIFMNKDRVYTKSEVSNMVDVFASRIGLTKEYLKERNITFHSHRHLFSTLLYESGEVSSDWIEYIMGHNQNGVKAIYTHLKNVSGTEVCQKVLKIIEENIL
jgi:integrase